MDMKPKATNKVKSCIAKGCLSIIVSLIVLGGGSYLYLRSPHFSGSVPSSMELTMWSQAEPSAMDEQRHIQVSLTNEQACASLFILLHSARLRMDHKCGDIGTLNIRYSSGKTDTLCLLPGHDPDGYEFRFGHGLYRVPQAPFFQCLRDAGVDLAKLSERKR